MNAILGREGKDGKKEKKKKKNKKKTGSRESINNSVSLAVNCQIKKRTKMPFIVRGYLR